MNQRVKYLFKNLSLLTLSNFSSKILVFLLVPLYTSILTTEEYGIFDLGISTVSLLFPILTLNIVDSVLRFSMERGNSKEDIAIIGTKSIAISIVLAGIVIFFMRIFGMFKGMEIYLFFYYVSYSFNQLLIQFSKGLDKVFDMAIAGVIGTFSMIVLNILFLVICKIGFVGFFMANILSQTIPACYLFIRLKFWKYIVTYKENKQLKKKMFIYCIPLIATALGWWVNNTLDKYAVTIMCGIAANGLLSVAYKIPSILNAIQSIFTQAWQISAIKEYGESDTATFYGKTFSIVNMLMCAACAWLIILTKPLATILYAKDFFNAWLYVPFLLISSVLNCAAGLLGSILSAKKNTNVMMWSAIIGALFNAFFNIVLIYFIGIQGATIDTFISSAIIYIVRRIGVGKDIIIEDKYYLTWGLLIIQALVEITIGNRVIEISLILLMLFINLKVIKQVKNQLINR